MKVDVEGAERDLLKKNTQWAARVCALKVEVHGAYSVSECRRDLAAIGFLTRRYRRHSCAVLAWRTAAIR